MRGSPPPPRPPPHALGFGRFLYNAFDPPLQDIFLHTPMHTCMTYAMYISLQPYVGRRIRGKCGMPPPPSRFVYMYALCIRTPFKIPGHANEYMSVIAWSTIVGRQIRGIRGATPPPPPVGFRFEYMHLNPISRFLAIYANAYVSVTQLILV